MTSSSTDETNGKIILTGTTGNLGSHILHHLLHTLRVPPSALILCTSSSPASHPLHPQTIPSPPSLSSSSSPSSSPFAIRHADFLAPQTLSAAFRGGSTLLLISYPSIAHEQRVAAHKNVLRAAREAGVQRVVYTSLGFGGNPEHGDEAGGGGARSTAAVMQAHLDTEVYLRKETKEGLEWVVLREGIYAESWALYLGITGGDRDGQGIVGRVPGKGSGGARVAWVGREDLAEATARVLADVHSSAGGRREKWIGKTVLLSGPQAVSLEETAELVSQALGAEEGKEEGPVSYRVEEVEDEEEWVQEAADKRAGGATAENVEFVRKWASTYPALRKGECAVVDSGVLEGLLERKPRTFKEVLEEGKEKDDAGARRNVERYAK